MEHLSSININCSTNHQKKGEREFGLMYRIWCNGFIYCILGACVGAAYTGPPAAGDHEGAQGHRDLYQNQE